MWYQYSSLDVIGYDIVLMFVYSNITCIHLKREVRLFQPPSQKGLDRTTELPRLCTFKNCPSKNQDSVDKQSPYKIPHQLGWLTHRKKWDIHLIKNIKACWSFVNQKFLWNGNLSPPMPHPTLWSLSGIKSARVSLSSTTWARRY